MSSPLAEQLQRLRGSILSARPAGAIATGVPGVAFFWNERPVPRSPLLYSAGLVFVAQGRKVGYLGGRRFEYNADTCLVLGAPVPFECEVQVDPGAPLLGFRIDVDPVMLHGLIARFAGSLTFDTREDSPARSGVEPLRIDGALQRATVRLFECLNDDMDRQLVGPAAVEEIIYRVLRSEHGRVLHDLTRHQSPYASIMRALDLMHGDYQRALTIEDLARASAMSVSSFHRAFKQVTSETPLQYLKKLRLLKAKELLVFEGLRVSEAAFEVGYGSASQFSRDFKRYFNVPPSEADDLPYSDAG